MKTLQLVFKTAANTACSINLSDPKDDLTLDEVKKQAASLIPVLVTKAGVPVTEFVKAVVTTTTQEELE